MYKKNLVIWIVSIIYLFVYKCMMIIIMKIDKMNLSINYFGLVFVVM